MSSRPVADQSPSLGPHSSHRAGGRRRARSSALSADQRVTSRRALVFHTATVSGPGGGTLAKAAASSASTALNRSSTPRLNPTRLGA